MVHLSPTLASTSAVPASLLFVSVRAGSARAQLAAAGPLPPAMRLAAVQRYETLERGGLAPAITLQASKAA